MAAVVLTKVGKSDITVTTAYEFVNRIYAQGYLPKTGTVAQAWQTLDEDAPTPPENPNDSVTLGEVQNLLAGKANRPVPDADLPARLSDEALRAASVAAVIEAIADGDIEVGGGGGSGGGHFVLPASNGTDDTETIHDALATHGVVFGRPGETYLVSTLVLPSDTALIGQGATLLQTAGDARNMFRNAAVDAARTVNALSITSGSATVTDADGTFTAADVGKAALVYCGDVGQPVFVETTVTSVTNANTAVLADPMPRTETVAGMSIGPRDRNIVISGWRWERTSTQLVAESNNSHNALFRRVDGLTVTDMTGGGGHGKYAFHIADARNFAVDRITLVDAPSDGVHIGGRCFYGKVRVRGVPGDDMAAITAGDYLQFNDVWGDVSDIDFDDCILEGLSNTINNGRAVMIGNDASGLGLSTRVRRIKVRRASSTVVEWPNVVFVGGRCDEVDIEDSAGIVSTGSVGDPVGRLSITRHQPAASYNFVVQVGPAGVRHLQVSDSRIAHRADAHLVTFGQDGGTVDDLEISNCVLEGSSAVFASLPRAGNRILRAALSSARLLSPTIGGARMVGIGYATGGVDNVRMVNCVGLNLQYVLSTPSDMDVTALGCRFTATHHLRLVGACTMTINADGAFEWYATKTDGVIYSTNPQMRIKLARLNPRNGDMAYSADGVTGPSICDGTTWRAWAAPVTSTNIQKLARVTQAEYDALTPDPVTLYVVVG